MAAAFFACAYWLKSAVFVAGAIALTALPRPARGRPVAAAIVALVLLVQMTWYLEHPLTHAPARWLHVHDFYHYYLGAKYYRELGHTRLYTCTAAAFADLDREGRRIPAIAFVRDLESPHQVIAGAALENAADTCRTRFTPARWRAFTGDLAVLLDTATTEREWRRILTDLGNNSPPTWHVLATPLANLVPLSDASLIALPLLDQIILLVVIPFTVWRCLGARAALAWLLIYSANPLAGYGWNAGSFLRTDWLLALVGAVCALARGRPALAGTLLALATLTRAFPGCFALAAGIALLWRTPPALRPFLRLTVAGLTTGILVTLAAVAGFGMDHVHEFVRLLALRIDPFGNNAIGLVKLGAFHNLLEWPVFPGGAAALDSLARWREAVAFDAATMTLPIRVLACALLTATLIAAWRLPAAGATVLLGSVAVFVLLAPFTYYWVFLALTGTMLFTLPPPRALAWLLFCAGILALRWFSIPWQHELGFDPTYYSVSYQQSRVLALLLALLAGSLLLGRTDAWSRTSGVRSAGTALAFAATLLSLWITRPRPAAADGFIAVDALAPALAERPRSRLQPATASWPGHAYRLLHLDGGEALALPLGRLRPGRYAVTLVTTHGGDLSPVVVALGGGAPYAVPANAARRDDPARAAAPLRPLLTSLGEADITAATVLSITLPHGRPGAVGIGGIRLQRLH